MLQKKQIASKLIITAFPILFLILPQQSCKKTDFSADENNNVNKAEQFFKLPTNVSSALQRVAEELKKQNTSKEFIEEFIAKQGFAIWNKASLFVKSGKVNTLPTNTTAANLSDLSDLSDTTIFIPLVLDNAKQVNAFIKAIVTDTVSMRLFKNNDYQNFPFQTITPATITTAENYALRIMQMDKDVFGYTAFDIKDKRLFNNNTDYKDTGTITRGIDFGNTTSNISADGFTINSVTQTLCFTQYTTTTTYACTTPNSLDCSPVCDRCAGWCSSSTTVSSEQCVSWEEEEGENGGWPVIPTGGGGSGGIGGGNPPPCSIMGPIISTNNPIAGCPPVPSVWPAVQPPVVLANQNIIDSLAGYPCAQLILAQIPNLNDKLKSIFVNTFGISPTINIKYKVDSSLNGQSNIDGQTFFPPTVINGVFTTTIGMNPWVLKHATREYILVTMLHEALHAYMDYNWHQFQLTHDTASFRQKFQIFWDARRINGINANELAQHEQMTLGYLETLTNSILSFNPNVSYQTAKSLAWGGLNETTMWYTPYAGDTTAINQTNFIARDTTLISNSNPLNLSKCK